MAPPDSSGITSLSPAPESEDAAGDERDGDRQTSVHHRSTLLKVMTWNAAKLTPSRQLLLQKLIDDHSPDVVAVTEADLDVFEANSVFLPGYATIVPKASKKVRVLLLVSDKLHYQSLDSDCDLPAVWIKIENPKIVIGGIYRQFSSAGQHGLSFEGEQIEAIITQIEKLAQAKNICVMGDFNLDMSRMGDLLYARKELLLKWTNALNAAGLTWLQTGPTWRSYGCFINGHRTSIIDHVYVSANLADHTAAVVLKDASTDHSPIIASLPLDLHSYPSGKGRRLSLITRRNFSAIDYEKVNEDIEKLGAWPAPRSGMDPNMYLEDLYATLQPILNKHVPTETFKVRRDTAPLLIRPDTRKVMDRRDEAREAGKKGEYKALRNKAVRLVRRDRVQTIEKKLKLARNPEAESWRLAKSLVTTSSTTLPLLHGSRTNSESAKLVNQFYIDKIKDIQKTFPDTSSRFAILESPTELQFSLHPVNVSTVKKAIRTMNNTHAIGVDRIPVAFWKGCERSLALPITHLVNLSIQTGIVPTIFKTAIIHPVYKGSKKDSLSPASYRPVSVLPALSKVLEKIVCEQLTAFLEENSILPNEQHGFRRRRSIVTAMVSAIHAWATRPRGGSGSPDLGIMAYDYSAAFDTVDATELDSKLVKIGASNKTRDWFKSYMEGGQQQVEWNGEPSNFLPVTVGVRQGSILGPMVFLFISMEIPDALNHECVGYADDNSAWASGKLVYELASDLEASSARLVDLSAKLKLSLNPAKTQLLWAGGSSALDTPSVSVAGNVIKPQETIEILGLRLDQKLSPAPYIADLRISLAQRLGMLRRIHVSMPRHTLARFAEGLFYGKLRVYAGVVFEVRLDEDDKRTKGAVPIQILINEVARLVAGKRRTDHIRIRDLLDMAGLPSLNEVVVQAAGMLAWHMSTEGHTLHNVYAKSCIRGPTRSATHQLVKTEIVPESIGIRNAQKVWNACPELRTAKSVQCAKRVLKSFIRSSIPL